MCIGAEDAPNPLFFNRIKLITRDYNQNTAIKLMFSHLEQALGLNTKADSWLEP